MYKYNSFVKEYKVTKISEGGTLKYKLKILSTGETVVIEDERVYRELVRSYWREDKRTERRVEKELSLDFEYSENKITLLDLTKSEEPTPEQSYLHKLQNQQLYSALKELPDYERDLLTCTVMDGMTIRNYAAMLDSSPSTIEYRKKKALKDLRKIFENIC